jgi:hypothetical protein
MPSILCKKPHKDSIMKISISLSMAKDSLNFFRTINGKVIARQVSVSKEEGIYTLQVHFTSLQSPQLEKIHLLNL